MKQKLSILAILCLFAISSIYAQVIPAGYYTSAENKSGAALKTALHYIIDNHTTTAYKSLDNIYRDSDVENGKIVDIYSTCSWTIGNKACGNYQKVCDCYNREHLIPQSWFNSASPMQSDAFHVVPTDGKVNGQRSSYPFGETNSGQSEDSKALGVRGTSSFPGYSGTIFEPDDEYKGDIARAYFYFATRYQDKMTSIGGEHFNNTTYPSFEQWTINLFLKWHRQDPVDARDLARQAGVSKHQKNRNPFIDYPELAEYIWGNNVGQNWTPGAAGTDPYLSSPSNNSTVTFEDSPIGFGISELINIKGGNLTGNLTVAISGTDASAFSVPNTTISQTNIESDNGADLIVTFTPNDLGTQTATLTISGGGLAYNTTITLKGDGTNDFKATDATHCTPTSFQANWSNKFGADSYSLDVFYFTTNGNAPDSTIFTTTFANGSFENGVTKTSGYSAFEQGALRMASGNNGCEIKLPALNLTNANIEFKVTAKQYGSDTGAKLFIEVDNQNAGSITTNSTMQDHSITFGGYTSNSVITVSADKGERVYLKDIEIIRKGATEVKTNLTGYPSNVGNVLFHSVTVPDFSTQYYYTVSAIANTSVTEISNTVQVIYKPTTDNNNIINQNIICYNSDNSIIIEGINSLSTINVYSVNGRLMHSEKTSSSANIDMKTLPKGLYIIKVTNQDSSNIIKVISGQ